MTDAEKPSHDSATEKTIQDALASVERLEREAEARSEDELDLDQVEVLPASELPPSGDPGDVGTAEEEIELAEDVTPAGNANNPMLMAMIQAKNEAVEALEQTQKEAKQLQERVVRTTADFENFKKRQTRERSEAVKFANEGLLKDMLPVLDNLERAVGAAKGADEPSEGGVSALLEGVEMVLRQFHDTLGRFGIQGFSALGKPFDPSRQEAVAQKEDASVPNQTVVEEYQKGFMLHDRLVRPAMVVVSTGGPNVAATPPPENGAENGTSNGTDESAS